MSALLGADVAHLSWNLVDDVRQLLQHQFMVNALRAGAVVAVLAGAIGWFMVLRREAFAGHTLALVGFPGAAGAVWLGVSANLGYYAFCVTAALVIAAASTGRGRARGEESAAIGTVQAFALACGFLFATLYAGLLTETNALLFGSFLGITSAQVVTLAVVAAVALAALTALARPLLFASVDADVAQARGLPVRLVSALFLVVLGVAVAEASQITGSLLVFALLVAPPAAAQRLTSRPGRGIVLSVVLAVAVTWLGLGIGYFSSYPIGFWITTFAFGVYVLAHAASRLGVRTC
ncbi:MAG TPA: iron chelate uptake ABC transporter family permease subunit [Acidimicrobiia bacterium]|nr:iron chelate uptake ABC transporter family permease subunit [Acidimicrobiia bacterium]